MDEEEVEVLETPVGQLLLGNGDDLVAGVEGVPELGGDENLLTLDDTLIDGPLQALAALDLVAFSESVD